MITTSQKSKMPTAKCWLMVRCIIHYRDVNGATGTTLVFGNGTGPRLDIRESISNEQAFADDYKQEVGYSWRKAKRMGAVM
jgi:hypothetical protein